LRAAFMGSPDFAVPSLQAAADACDLRLVVCQPDKPAGRGQRLTAPAVKAAATAMGLPILQPAKMRDGTLRSALEDHDLDLILVVAFGRILPADILAVPRHGCINVHGSLLPRWRGAAPIQRAVLAGDTETGVCVMAMDEGLDTGPVYRQVATPIDPAETSGHLFERLAVLGAETLGPFLREFPNVPSPTPQNELSATHAPPLLKSEAAVDWARPVRTVVDHIRGMDPWPVAFTSRDEEPVKLFTASPSEREPTGALTGTIVGVDAQGLHVRVADGVVRIAEVQLPGKRRMPAQAYAAGRPFGSGERFESVTRTAD